VDTNILLRFLSGEPAFQATAAKNLFTKASTGEAVLDISPVIVAETYYTLLSYYGVERKTAIEKLSSLLRQRGVRLREASQVFLAFELLRTTNVGFADAFLAAGASEEEVPVASFDRDLDKFKGVARIDPGDL
jgi:predicted nucleic acid-binding protein